MVAWLLASIARWTWKKISTFSARPRPSTTFATMETRIELSLQRDSGSSAKIQVDPGTMAANILDSETNKLPAGCSARLLTETGEALEPNSQVWKAQAVHL